MQDLCSFETFNTCWKHYGYGGDQQELIDREFKRSKGKRTLTFLSLATLKPAFKVFVFSKR